MAEKGLKTVNPVMQRLYLLTYSSCIYRFIAKAVSAENGKGIHTYVFVVCLRENLDKAVLPGYTPQLNISLTQDTDTVSSPKPLVSE